MKVTFLAVLSSITTSISSGTFPLSPVEMVIYIYQYRNTYKEVPIIIYMTNEKETLSDKKLKNNSGIDYPDYYEEDVKEFIKKLKEELMFPSENNEDAISELKDSFNKSMFDKIDKLAGKELIE